MRMGDVAICACRGVLAVYVIDCLVETLSGDVSDGGDTGDEGTMFEPF
jgi:hypothetical protein